MVNESLSLAVGRWLSEKKRDRTMTDEIGIKRETDGAALVYALVAHEKSAVPHWCMVDS